MRFLLLFSSISLILSCQPNPPDLKTGTWRGVIALQGKELPFTFDVEKTGNSYQAYLKNVTEKILLDEISFRNDSVFMTLHVFDADLRGKVSGNMLTGTFYKKYAPDFSLPFTASLGDDYRFVKNSEEATAPDYSGTYQLEFKPDKDPAYTSVGVFEQKGNHLTGTFLTPVGDYRYLEGNVVDGQLNLSTFDGNHAFLFTATLSGDSIHGDYYSGKSAHEVFYGVKNPNAKMPDPESLTLLKEGYERIDFTFPDVNGKPVKPTDERFRDKVLILQIFGTWCPNCMDETKFLSQWYRDNHDRGVEILGLAYERKPEFDYASSRVIKMKEKLNVPYEFVIAGINDKEEAAKTLPMLNRVLAFPTTILIGRDGKVKHIYTGFEGPGTGIYHERFKERFNQLINELLNEKTTSSINIK
ncbi:MAG: TlpA family protein disulfide reductase [Cyclobacteriaceae bacterium]|nr:TlpA family protein disulfide reductase [Cyclobacteriaceae bacterium]